jgi:hypothetical protein
MSRFAARTFNRVADFLPPRAAGFAAFARILAL